MGVVSTEGPPTAQAAAQPYVAHYRIELAALHRLRDAYASGDQAGADSAVAELRAEAPRARELGCGLIQQVKSDFPALDVDALMRARGIDKLCTLSSNPRGAAMS